MPWNWTSTAEYFDEIDGRLGINAAFMVGHSAIRRVVMGEECVGRPATPDEIAAMQALLRAGFEAGGLGFSSSWARTHNDAEGNMVPSRYATHDEIVALAKRRRRVRGHVARVHPAGRPRSSTTGPSSSWPTCPPARSARSTGTS